MRKGPALALAGMAIGILLPALRARTDCFTPTAAKNLPEDLRWRAKTTAKKTLLLELASFTGAHAPHSRVVVVVFI